MTKKKKKTIVSPQQFEVIKQLARDFDDRNNRLMERTAQTVLPLISYCNNKLEDMTERLDEICEHWKALDELIEQTKKEAKQ